MASKKSSRHSRPIVIGPYEVHKRIGAGGMGAVYKAVHRDLGREVALKVLPAELAEQADMIERFRLEAQHAAKLRHEHVVTLYEFGSASGTYYLAMEYVEGVNLHAYIDHKGRLDADEARRLLAQAARALAAAHKQGIVHRDIKPSNFLLTDKEGRAFVKLTDFGLALTHGDEDFKLTHTGTTVGTVDYISPEQARNSRAVDIRSDIYSLGCTLYHMLTGRPPFPEGDLTERLLKHVEAEPPDVRQFNPRVPAGMVVVLKKMMAKRPEDRYQVPADLLEDLENLPTGPALNPREALEALAMASGEKPRPPRTSAAETRKSVREPTQPLATPTPTPTPAPAEPPRLRYRNLRDHRRRRASNNPDAHYNPLLVLEGWGPWLAIAGIALVIVLLLGTIAFKWGGRSAISKAAQEEEARAEGPGDIETEGKGRVESVKEQLKERRADANQVADRESAQQLLKEQGLQKIYTPDERLLQDLHKEFDGTGKGPPRPNMEAIRQATRQADTPGVSDNQAPGSDTPSPEAQRPFAKPEQQTTPSGKEPTTPNPPPSQSTEGPKTPDSGKPSKPLRSPQDPSPPRTQRPDAAPGTVSPPPPGAAPRPAADRPGQEGSAPVSGRPAASPSQGQRPPAQRESGSPATPPAREMPRTDNPVTGPQQAPPPRSNAPYAALPGPEAGSGVQRPEPVGASVTYRVERTANGRDRSFSSIGAALAEAARSRGVRAIVEVRDNGPLFESSLAVSGCDIVLRASPGFRPLIVWDVSARSTSSYWLNLAGGSLSLENLDLAVHCPASGTANLTAFLRIEGGELNADRCTISVAGRHPTGLAAIRLEAAPSGAPASACRLSRCYLRGTDLVAFDLRCPAHVLLNGCLLAGGRRPLVEVVGRDGNDPVSLRIARSTLAAGSTLLHVRPATAADRKPAVLWRGWDTLLTRPGTEAGGEMVVLDEGADVAGMSWSSFNCLYAGWQTLLRSPTVRLGQQQLSLWHQLWHQTGGDEAQGATWPAVALAEPSELPAATFRTIGTPVGYAATSGQAAIGCDIASLPPTRDGWAAFAGGRISALPLEPASTEAPEIPSATDGGYCGGRIDLAGIDLGEYLRDAQASGPFGRRVVLRLSGRGEMPTSPIRIRGSSLVLYFEPSADERDRLVLVPKGGAAAALVEVEGGDCEVIGGVIRYAGGHAAQAPTALFKVQGGDLRMTRCRIQGLPPDVPPGYRSLIDFRGPTDASGGTVHDCVLSDCVLLSDQACVQAAGAGVRVRLENCATVAGTDAFRWEPGPTPGTRLNVLITLDRCTVAAQRAAVAVGDATTPLPAEPVLVQIRRTAFLAPFLGGPSPSSVLAPEGAALAHGLVVWQGDGNGYDHRLQGYILVPGATGVSTTEAVAAWSRLCGSAGDRRALLLDMPASRPLDLNRPQFDRLQLPASVRQKLEGGAPGADLERLGLVRRPGRSGS
jgi:serine/threonine-protein kinase